MLMKQLNYFALLLVVLMAMPVSSLQAKNKKDKTAKEQQMTTGAQDRAVRPRLLALFGWSLCGKLPILLFIIWQKTRCVKICQ